MTGARLLSLISHFIDLAHQLDLSLFRTDYAEERASELEVLESIFPDELEGRLSPNSTRGGGRLQDCREELLDTLTSWKGSGLCRRRRYS